VAAAIPTALVATQTPGADAPADRARSADATPMPQIRLGKYLISRLIVGCHNIDGGSHMSPFLDQEMHEYYTPERAVQTLRRCEEVGINTWQGHERGTLLGIYNRHRKSGGKMYLLGLTGWAAFAVYLAVQSTFSKTSVIAVILCFLIAQLFIASRAWLRVAFQAAQKDFLEAANPGLETSANLPV
jgi:hypothetical protein